MPSPYLLYVRWHGLRNFQKPFLYPISGLFYLCLCYGLKLTIKFAFDKTWTCGQSVKSALSVPQTVWPDFAIYGQLFKAFGNNRFAQISHIFRQFFVKKSKIYYFSSEIIFDQLL